MTKTVSQKYADNLAQTLSLSIQKCVHNFKDKEKGDDLAANVAELCGLIDRLLKHGLRGIAHIGIIDLFRPSRPESEEEVADFWPVIDTLQTGKEGYNKCTYKVRTLATDNESRCCLWVKISATQGTLASSLAQLAAATQHLTIYYHPHALIFNQRLMLRIISLLAELDSARPKTNNGYITFSDSIKHNDIIPMDLTETQSLVNLKQMPINAVPHKKRTNRVARISSGTYGDEVSDNEKISIYGPRSLQGRRQSRTSHNWTETKSEARRSLTLSLESEPQSNQNFHDAFINKYVPKLSPANNKASITSSDPPPLHDISSISKPIVPSNSPPNMDELDTNTPSNNNGVCQPCPPYSGQITKDVIVTPLGRRSQRASRRIIHVTPSKPSSGIVSIPNSANGTELTNNILTNRDDSIPMTNNISVIPPTSNQSVLPSGSSTKVAGIFLLSNRINSNGPRMDPPPNIDHHNANPTRRQSQELSMEHSYPHDNWHHPNLHIQTPPPVLNYNEQIPTSSTIDTITDLNQISNVSLTSLPSDLSPNDNTATRLIDLIKTEPLPPLVLMPVESHSHTVKPSCPNDSLDKQHKDVMALSALAESINEIEKQDLWPTHIEDVLGNSTQPSEPINTTGVMHDIIISQSRDEQEKGSPTLSMDDIPLGPDLLHLPDVIPKGKDCLVRASDSLVSAKSSPNTVSLCTPPSTCSPDSKESVDSSLLLSPVHGTGVWTPLNISEIYTTIYKPPKHWHTPPTYACSGCGKLRMTFTHGFRFCQYTGLYFCRNCHHNDYSIIPARVVHKWCFKKYSVSIFGREAIKTMSCDPIYNLPMINPLISASVPVLRSITRVRHQLFYIMSYLRTCRLGQLLIAKIPNLYYADAIDLYSLKDLLDAYQGHLFPLLNGLARDLIRHIATCELCQAKGHICSICNRDDVIFPFQLDKVVECNACNALFHKGCFPRQCCPICQRIRMRGKRGHRRE